MGSDLTPRIFWRVGWIHTRRDHLHQGFILLRHRHGRIFITRRLGPAILLHDHPFIIVGTAWPKTLLAIQNRTATIIFIPAGELKVPWSCFALLDNTDKDSRELIAFFPQSGELLRGHDVGCDQ